MPAIVRTDAPIMLALRPAGGHVFSAAMTNVSCALCYTHLFNVVSIFVIGALLQRMRLRFHTRTWPPRRVRFATNHRPTTAIRF